jgi:glyoxylase-like metal-dependent hydrolase (beta-lactamase superfamily II)
MGLINESNSLLIVGDSDVVVVDAQSSVGRTLETLGALRRITSRPVRAVINTHWHDDHVFGNGVYRDSFPAVQLIAHRASAEDLAATGLTSRADLDTNREGTRDFLLDLVSRGQSFAGSGPMNDEERASHRASAGLISDYGRTPPGYRPQPPTTLVEDSLVLRQGRRVIRVLFLGRGHSRGDLVVHLPAERIVAAGDLVMFPVQFVGTTSFPADFAETEDRLIALAPERIVPGHGPVLQGTGHPRLISRMLHSLTDQVRAARARGETLDQVKAGVTLGEYERAFAGVSPMLRILFGYYVTTPAVQRAYELH